MAMTKSLLPVNRDTVESLLLEMAQRSGPAKNEWELRRSQITHLYRDEKMKLKEVMAIMKGEGFIATERMYKDRIKKWGLAKNIKEHEAVAILRVKSERELQGKTTSIELHNQTVEIDRLLRHAKRRGTKYTGQTLPAIPPYIQCKTPPPAEGSSATSADKSDPVGRYNRSAQIIPISSIILYSDSLIPTQRWSGHHAFADAGRWWTSEEASQMTLGDICGYAILEESSIDWPLSPPTRLGSQEQLLYSIQTHFASSFASGAWKTGLRGCTINQISIVAPPHCSATFIAYCFTALEFWRRGLLVDFRRVLSKACELIPHILQATYPRALDRILSVFLMFMREGLPEVTQSLRRYVAQMATNVRNGSSPWLHLFQLLGQLEDGSLEEALVTSWKCTNDSLRSGFGRFTESSLKADLRFLEVVYGSDNHTEEERLLRRLLGDFEKHLGIGAPLAMKITISMAENLWKQGKSMEAEDLANGILIASLEGDSDITVVMQMNVFGLLAASQYGRGAFSLAEKSMRRYIEVTRQEWGMENPWIIRGMATLEGWLREWDRIKEAEELRKEMNSVIGSDETDIQISTIS